MIRILVATAVVLLLGATASRAFGPTFGHTLHQRVFFVRTGDTLWTIAAQHTATGADIRDTLDALVDANDLASTTIYPGQRLVLEP